MEIKGDAKVANPNEWVENDEIPDCLKKLTKIILRAFYSPEHSLGELRAMNFDYSAPYFGVNRPWGHGFNEFLVGMMQISSTVKLPLISYYSIFSDFILFSI